MASVAVYCGSSAGSAPEFREAAVAVGQELARSDHRLVYGGGDVGLMGAVANATLDAGGDVLGIITEHLMQLEVGHRGVTELLVEPDMHTRKASMARHSDGVIVLPGGFGTLDETFEVLTWNQLGVHPGNGGGGAVPVVFLDVDGYFDGLFEFVDRVTNSGFMRPEHGAMAQRTLDPATAVELATSPPPAMLPKWVDTTR